MGKYSNINSASLLSTANSALNELSKYNVGSLKKEIISKSIFNSSANKIVDNSLSSIDNSKTINGSISVLKEKLNNLIKCAEKINSYKQIEQEITNLERSLYNWDGSFNNYVYSQLLSKKTEINNLEQAIDNLLI